MIPQDWEYPTKAEILAAKAEAESTPLTALPFSVLDDYRKVIHLLMGIEDGVQKELDVDAFLRCQKVIRGKMAEFMHNRELEIDRRWEAAYEGGMMDFKTIKPAMDAILKTDWHVERSYRRIVLNNGDVRYLDEFRICAFIPAKCQCCGKDKDKYINSEEKTLELTFKKFKETLENWRNTNENS